MSMRNLQSMALQMQQEMERIQGELAEATVEGSAGGGAVRAVVTGKGSKQRLVFFTDPSWRAKPFRMLRPRAERPRRDGADSPPGLLLLT